MSYDLIVVGGGVAGSSLARRMALPGARVLVVERETQFRDRVRGEALQPWGVTDVKRLGIADELGKCANELRWFEQILNGQHAFRRDLVATTPNEAAMWAFYHPEAQEILLSAAAGAGAEVRRGATVTRIEPGQRPKVTIESGGQSTQAEARVVALCAGRNPALRTELGFEVRRGSIPLLLSGVLLTNLPADVDRSVVYISNNLAKGTVSGLFPQKGDRARAYFGYHANALPRIQGENDFERFRKEFTEDAGGMIPFGEAKPAGPLASFECLDVWVDHPYRDGVALVGDAASSNDPSWGQGLSLAFRDARVLSDELLAGNDWDAAGHRYAEQHDRYYGAVRMVSGWFYDIFQRPGPEADARRARALPLIAADQTRVPDVLFSGPEFPLHANSRTRFFGEDTMAAQA